VLIQLSDCVFAAMARVYARKTRKMGRRGGEQRVGIIVVGIRSYDCLYQSGEKEEIEARGGKIGDQRVGRIMIVTFRCSCVCKGRDKGQREKREKRML